MKLAVIGSRSLQDVILDQYISKEVQEIVSGGARGVDSCAAEYAKRNGLKLIEFFPLYEKYGYAAPIIRNRKIVDYADKVIAFWDGKSKGTLSVIQYAQKTGKACEIIHCEQQARQEGQK